MTWCSARECKYAARVKNYERQPITCRCLYIYCFVCSEEWHSPAGCELMRLWVKETISDGQTANWIRTYTKDCPKCAVKNFLNLLKI